MNYMWLLQTGIRLKRSCSLLRFPFFSILLVLVGQLIIATAAAAELPADPTLTYDSPTAGTDVSAAQDIVVQVTALDDGGIKNVYLWSKETADATFTSHGTGEVIDGTYQWNLGRLPAGEYRLNAKAMANDSGSVVGSITITVSNEVLSDPTVTFNSPANGLEIPNTQDVFVKLTAGDDSGIQEVSLWSKETADATYTRHGIGVLNAGFYEWNLGMLPVGEYRLNARASAIDGGSVVESITFTVINDLPSDPTLSFDSPVDGANIPNTQDAIVKVTAADDGGIDEVLLWSKETADTTFTSHGAGVLNNGTYQWDLGRLPPGSYRLNAKVFATDGGSVVQSISVTVSNDLPSDPTVIFDSPTNGTVITNTLDVLVTITALDDSGINKVALWSREAADATFTSHGLGVLDNGSYQWNVGNFAVGTYTLRAKATATDTATQAAVITIQVVAGTVDTEPPAPNPASWASLPTAVNGSSIRMTATTGSDVNEVEYRFQETSGNPGATDSGWQSSPTYTDFGLTPLTVYSYTVTMRDTLGNTGSPSNASSAMTEASSPGGRPNIIFIYADDLGYADISYNQAVRDTSRPYLAHTPNIDAICTEGVYFSNYVTHQMCSPSRAGLLTGRHYTEVGSGIMVGGELDRDVMTIAKDFQSNNYVTGAFGKWHNGKSKDASSPGIGVNAYGFDEWEGFYGGSADGHSRIKNGQMFWWKNGVLSENDFPGYASDILRDRAINFIEANKGNPFFLYIPFGAVHTPYHILSSDLKFICDKFDAQYPHLAWNNVRSFTSPSSGKMIGQVSALRCSSGEEFDVKAFENIDGFAELVYYAMIYSIDRAVGGIRQKLQVEGLEENSILVFASDNGATRYGNNGLLRGTKTTGWEGGIRVPAAMWWPGIVDKNTADGGNEYSYLSQYIDWYPTLMDAAGLTVSPAADLDGVSFLDAVLAGTPARRDDGQGDDWFYGLAWDSAIIKNNRFKLHYNQVPGSGHVEELYDLYANPGEDQTVNDVFPDKLNTLKGKLEDWFGRGDVTASYMQLPDFYKNRPTVAAPAGDILEVTVNQTGMINSETDGLSIAFAKPDWRGDEIAQFVHAGDVLEYDIYVAGDSGQTTGICLSTTRKNPIHNCPVVDGTSGIGLDDKLVVKKNFPKNTWTRCVVGVGDTAPENSSDMVIGFWAAAAGTYHVYIDNVVIRKKDGSIRAVVWQDSNHSYGTADQRVYFDDQEYSSLTDLKAKKTGVKFGGFTVKTATLGDL